MVDPIMLFIATGWRISELMGLRWSDFDANAATISMTGKVVRQKGNGLVRVPEPKSAAGWRTIRCPASR